MYGRLVGYNRDLTMPLSSQPPHRTQKCYFLLIDQSAQTAVYTTAIRAVVYCLSSNKLLASLCSLIVVCFYINTTRSLDWVLTSSTCQFNWQVKNFN